MNTIVAIIGVIFIVGLFAYLVYLTDGAERERR
jgi:hypothetical protein